MKKYAIVLLCLLSIGCGKNNTKDIRKNMIRKYDKLSSYTLNGKLKMYNGENIYSYEVNVNYKKTDFYKVSLVNEVNNHEQIIIRNNDGVYVLTPSLNKSFKFQSDWPYNNSQIYIIDRLVYDIKNMDGNKIEKDNDDYIINTNVNYSTNNELTKQKIYLDKKYNIKKIEIYNNSNELKMNFEIINLKLNNKIDNNMFELKENLKTDKVDSVSNQIDNIIYPMNIPNNTKLDKQEIIGLDNGQRVILSYVGESPFTIIEETTSISENQELNMVMGYPDIVIDTIGNIDNNLVSWISNGIEYTVLSDQLSKDKLISVAKSISFDTITK